MSKYMMPRGKKTEGRTVVGRLRTGKLWPVMAVKVGPSEGGMLRQKVTAELDRIMGRMITPITFEMVSVFVPAPAMDAIKDPNADYAGLPEVVKQKLLSGVPLFGLENENTISKLCRVNPRSIGGVKKVSETVRLAYNCAVNHLRQQKYVYASLLPHTNAAVTPALLGSTILQRMRGVLDPDDRINGQIQLDLPSVSLPVEGLGFQTGGAALAGPSNVMETDNPSPQNFAHYTTGQRVHPSQMVMELTAAGLPKVYAKLNGIAAGGVSQADIYNAEQMDRLTREMRQIVDDNPQYGEEMVLRWVHGLSMDPGKVCVTLAHRETFFDRAMVQASDTAGVEAETMASDMISTLEFAIPVAKTELGGVIITMIAVRPDETISSQPHPELSDVWTVENYAADELKIDPVPVTMRELDSDVSAGSENTVAFYTGLNQMRVAYMDYGLNRVVDPDTVDNKTAIWQYEIPMSVTPENILYPETLDQYPWALGANEVVSYTVESQKAFESPMVVGPTPVEELAVIDAEDVFETEE